VVDPPILRTSIEKAEEAIQMEAELIKAIEVVDLEAINKLKRNAIQLQKDWSFMQDCLRDAVATNNIELCIALVKLFCEGNVSAYQVGEYAAVTAIANNDIDLVLSLLDLWSKHKGFEVVTALDVIAFAVQAAPTNSPQRHGFHKRQKGDIKRLVETVIYVATVEKYSESLRILLDWVNQNQSSDPLIADVQKMNADCILHASLEEDKDQVKILYDAGYRLAPDETRRLNKDYLKKIKLFRAMSSPTYCTVAFENSQDVERHDPLKKCLEYSLQARRYAGKIQDFNKEYNEVAQKCESFAMKLLDKCTTKHEVQTLLQTKSYRGHHDANFNIAILDGHKEFVAHEKFQQLLHKKWGQRDRVHYGDDIRVNIFWAEMGKFQKIGHCLKQLASFIILPLIFILITLFPCAEKNAVVQSIVIQTHIPVNRFIYFEISKFLFSIIIIFTLVDEQDIAWYDVLSCAWIFSYILEDFRTLQRLYKQGQGTEENFAKTTRRWITFRNMYILLTNLTFLISLILRFTAYFNNQCRRGCPYEPNRMAFIGACFWSVAALLTFLRSIQTGLMWRQTGPIIISMSYMILDVFVFLFIFVIVYFSFTLCVVYIYGVYDFDRTSFFNTHKMAFKLFYWALIRTGNPHFPNIREFNATIQYFNSSCLSTISGEGTVAAADVGSCAIGRNDQVGEFDTDIEEGIPYITGNALWAFYQFIVFIVLLSVLRARMVNTYHRIFREADVQWKFFRASIWWKYLDHNTILPPPFTFIFLIHYGMKKLLHWFRENTALSEEDVEQNNGLTDRREFHKRYKKLLLTLLTSDESSWDFHKTTFKSSGTKSGSAKSNMACDAGGD
jgi:transient receptor potential cation channel subfamily C protein 6